MKIDFITPALQGARFADHTLPLEFAKDLAAYGELILDVSKYLYFKEHPGRQRVPNGFEDEFDLHLDRIQEGSTLPVLALVTAGFLVHAPSRNAAYFDQAREVVLNWIQNETDGTVISPEFPAELFEHFNVLGRSLRVGETMKFSSPSSKTAVLTPENRRSLALRARNSYLDQFIINGTVSELDLDRRTFRLKIDESTPIIVPFHTREWKEVKDALGMSLWRATVRGVGEFDRSNVLQKVISTNSIEVVPNHLVVSQFEELRTLADGWCHELSKAPNSGMIDWAISQFEKSYPAELGLPLIGASPEGNIFIEWVSEKHRISAEIEYPSFRCQAQAVVLTTAVAVNEEFDLSLDVSWNRLYEFVRSHLNDE